jgi:hypothetical protein
MFEFVLTLAISIFEKILDKRKENGKSNKLVKKLFSSDTQNKVDKFYESYTLARIELSDELEDGGVDL